MNMTARHTSDGPWCWMGKAALNRIEEASDGRTDRAHLLAVYVTLCRIASNKATRDSGEGPFEVAKGELASRSGVSYRKCADLLVVLQGIGLLDIKQNLIEGTKEQGPNTYRLLPYGTQCRTSGTVCLTIGTENLRLGTDAEQTSLPRVLKNNTEEQSEEHVSAGKVESSISITPTTPAKKARPAYSASAEACEIYDAYPRKVKKADALKAIQKALGAGDVTGATLLERTRAYAAAVSQWTEDEQQYVPHPTSWFNGRRWEDDPGTWKSKSAPRASTHSSLHAQHPYTVL